MNFLTIKTFIFMNAKTRRMNLQTEKLQLIEWVLKLQDVELVKQLLEIQRKSERVVDRDRVVGSNPDGSPITVKDLVARAEESERDIAAGRVSDLDDVMERLLGS